LTSSRGMLQRRVTGIWSVLLYHVIRRGSPPTSDQGLTIRYVASRVLQAGATLLVFMVVVFAATRAGGDPALNMLPATATPQQIEAMRHKLGEDRPYPQQFAIFMKGMVTLDYGRSAVNEEAVTSLLSHVVPNTLKLALATFILVLVTSLPLGVLAATHRGQVADKAVRLLAAGGQAAPPFWVGLVLIELLAVRLRWLPVSGNGEGGLDAWRYYLMPAFTWGLLLFAGLARLLRSSMLENLDADFVTLARAKGVPAWKIVWVHVFRNAALPILTFVAIWTGTAVTGSVVVEQVFNWPGIGALFINSVLARDLPVVEAVAELVAIAVLAANLAADLLYAVIDPRVRITREAA
jgi:peptide/nickel transport system permease protein